ncbi:MAG: MXAN_6640 family putative metalloprotease [Myxococcota bacterium]
MLWLVSLAHAVRPTEGGMWAFDDTDVVTTVDSPTGTARVWYSTDGPNAVKAGDDDADGVPDFAQSVAAYTEDVLVFYEEAGFRPPVSDEGRGGDDAMDVYLVDFGGNADGAYTAENCDTVGTATQCDGYFVMENDFAGYGYSDVDTAIRVLTSHELFHAVQAAYDAGEGVWLSEGTAVWAEQLYDPLNEDFVAFCDAYLDDTARSLNEPPTGPVPTFAYATAIWWWFLSNRYGDDVIVELMEATETSEDEDATLAAMAAVEEARGGSLAEDFATFARWNLATGSRAGVAESYPFAEDIGGIRPDYSGESISDENRFYPLATTYMKVDHEGGPLAFATAEASPDLVFSLHATEDEKITDQLAEWQDDADLGDLDAGIYWIVAVNPTLAENSTKVLFCAGPDVSACAGEDTGDTGKPPAADDTGEDDPGPGCGCDAGGGVAGAWLLVLASLATRRRRA